jgi:peptidoglycan-associated lipoprotein
MRALPLWMTIAVGCAHQAAAPPAPPAPRPAARGDDRPALPAAPMAVAARTAQRSAEPDAIFFGVDDALLRDEARPALQEVARWMTADPAARLRIEGNCDERGTTEYNIALGESRARAARQYLIDLGVPASRIDLVSYGSERPRALGHDETAWARNRRDDLRPLRAGTPATSPREPIAGGSRDRPRPPR